MQKGLIRISFCDIKFEPHESYTTLQCFTLVNCEIEFRNTFFRYFLLLRGVFKDENGA